MTLGDVLWGARCPFPVSLAPSRGKAILTFQIPKAIVSFPIPKASINFPIPKALQSRMDGAGGQAEPCLIPAPPSPPVSHHPTALVPLVTSKGRLKPEQMNSQHLETSPPPSPPGEEKGS